MSKKSIDSAAEDVVAKALSAAGYDGWVHTMTRGEKSVILVSERPVKDAVFTYEETGDGA